MMFWQKIKQHISSQLALPVMMAMGLILLTVVVLEFFHGYKRVIAASKSTAEYAQHSASIVVAMNGSIEQTAEVLKAPALAAGLTQFFLVDANNLRIMASKDGQFIGHILTQSLSGVPNSQLKTLLVGGQQVFTQEQRGAYLYASMLNKQAGSPAVLAVFQVDQGGFYAEVYKRMAYIALVLTVCFIGIAAVFSVALQMVVLKPVEHILDTILAHRKSRTNGLVDIASKDEIGLLASAYNQLSLSNRAREESLRLNSDELVKAKCQADEANKAKSEFLASMSHEIRTPMNGVIGMLNILEKSKLDKDQKHKFRLAKSSGESLLSLINDILDFSKIEAGKLELEEIEFNLCDVLADLCESMATRAEENNVTLFLDLTGVDESLVVGDSSRIRQVFTNLIGNAIKFTEAGYVGVFVETQRTDDQLTLSAMVKDSGIGISQDSIEILFDSFRQEDASTTRKYGGTGLGLSICLHLCKLMNGGITVRSELGRGSQFSFQLQLSASTRAQSLKPRTALDKIGMLVLLDNIEAALAVERQVAHWGGQVRLVSRASEIEDQLDALASDCQQLIVFVDERIVQKFSTPLPQLFLAHQRKRDIHCILLRSISSTHDMAYWLEQGYFHSITKPVIKRDLIETIELVSGEINLEEIDKHQAQALMCYNGLGADRVIRILLVEDNAINQEVALGMLEDMHFQAECAESGLIALKTLFARRTQARFDIVLMDCQMPDMDGFECTQLIRHGEAGEEYSDIPIIALTANVMEGDKERCLKSGMNAYLSKPIDGDALERAIYKWFQYAQQNDDGSVDTQVPSTVPSDKHEDNPSANAADREASASASAEHLSGSDSMGASSDMSGAQAMPFTSDLDIWDKGAALARIRNKPERLVRLITRFLADLPEDIKALDASIQVQAFDDAKRHSHTIKGVAGNLSAMALMDVACESERASAKSDQALSQLHYQSIVRQFNLLEPELRRYIHEWEEASKGKAC